MKWSIFPNTYYRESKMILNCLDYFESQLKILFLHYDIFFISVMIYFFPSLMWFHLHYWRLLELFLLVKQAYKHPLSVYISVYPKSCDYNERGRPSHHIYSRAIRSMVMSSDLWQSADFYVDFKKVSTKKQVS